MSNKWAAIIGNDRVRMMFLINWTGCKCHVILVSYKRRSEATLEAYSILIPTIHHRLWTEKVACHDRWCELNKRSGRLTLLNELVRVVFCSRSVTCLSSLSYGKQYPSNRAWNWSFVSWPVHFSEGYFLFKFSETDLFQFQIFLNYSFYCYFFLRHFFIIFRGEGNIVEYQTFDDSLLS